MFKKIEKEIEKVQKLRKKEYSKSINREKKIEKVQKSRKKEYSKSINREKIEKEYSKSSPSGSPEVKSSLSGSSHIAVTILHKLVLMTNYSISANVFCLFAMSSQGKTQREEREKKKTFKPRARNDNHTSRSFALAFSRQPHFHTQS